MSDQDPVAMLSLLQSLHLEVARMEEETEAIRDRVEEFPSEKIGETDKARIRSLLRTIQVSFGRMKSVFQQSSDQITQGIEDHNLDSLIEKEG